MKQTEPGTPPLLTYKQLAERLNICLNSARALVDAGEIPRITVGARNQRVSPSSVDAYIERQTK